MCRSSEYSGSTIYLFLLFLPLLLVSRFRLLYLKAITVSCSPVRITINEKPWLDLLCLMLLSLGPSFYLLNICFSKAYLPFSSFQFNSVQFSRSVGYDSLGPHGLQYVRLPCPSPTPGAYSNSCSLSGWCHPAVSSSVIPFSSCLQSFPASGPFPVSQFFASGGQSIGVSASASVLPMNIQEWFLLGWTGWISLQSKGLSKVFSNTTVQKHQFFNAKLSL